MLILFNYQVILCIPWNLPDLQGYQNAYYEEESSDYFTRKTNHHKESSMTQLLVIKPLLSIRNEINNSRTYAPRDVNNQQQLESTAPRLLILE